MQVSIQTVVDDLQAEDLAWISANVETLNLLPDAVLLIEGGANSDIFVVDDGLLSVYTDNLEPPGFRYELDRLGPGSLVGDISWLDQQLAVASVRAIESSVVLRLSGAALRSKMQADFGFAVRFLRGIARLNSVRLKEKNIQLIRHIASNTQSNVVSLATQTLFGHFELFRSRLLEVDRQLLSASDRGRELIAAQIKPAFEALVVEFNNVMTSDLAEHVRVDIGAIVQRDFLPLLALTHVTERFYSKPRGYAGDYHTIELIYRNAAQGHGRLGPIIDQCFLERPPPKAVRNRRKLIAAEILSTLSASSVANVTSLGSGPALEMLDVFMQAPDARVAFTAIDIDHEALECVEEWAERHEVANRVHTKHGNLLYITTGRQQLDIRPQQLIYSVGLIDYFNDRFVIKMLDWIHGQLAPGGRVLLGNFHPRNPDKAFMDHVLEWRLIHRNEDDMNRLFAASKFGSPCSRILFEDEGINLFAEGVRA